MKLLFGIVISVILSVNVFLPNAKAQEDGLDHLRKNIPGEPGKDYPIHGASILCKLNPRQCGGQSGGSGNGGRKGGGGGNGGQGGNNNGGKNKGGRGMGGQTKGKTNGRGNSNKAHTSNSTPSMGQQNTAKKPTRGQMQKSNMGKNGNSRAKGKNNSNGNAGSGNSMDDLDALRRNIPGEPGKDYPINSFDIVCKLNPRQCGGKGGASNGGKKGGGGNMGNQQNRMSNSGSSTGQNNSKKKPSRGQMSKSNMAKNGTSKTKGKGNSNNNSGSGSSMDELDALRRNIPGEPGKDYPIHSFNIVCKLNPRQCGKGK